MGNKTVMNLNWLVFILVSFPIINGIPLIIGNHKTMHGLQNNIITITLSMPSE